MNLKRGMDCGYYSLASLMEVKGYKSIRKFENDYHVYANHSGDGSQIFFNAEKHLRKDEYSLIAKSPPKEGEV